MPRGLTWPPLWSARKIPFFPLKRGPQKDSYDESMGSDGKATNHKAVALVIEHSIKLKYLMPKSVLLCQFLKLSHSPVSAIREQF